VAFLQTPTGPWLNVRYAYQLPASPLLFCFLPQTRDYPPKMQAQGKVQWVCTQQARRRTIGKRWLFYHDGFQSCSMRF